ncbi:hypothetical protein [Microcoleus sp. T2B6]|uniref:hypothetical protein n=1 Tax=Microcoleus sp. T2B6 TaxID=3055424 RepID=UPI002FD19D5D
MASSLVTTTNLLPNLLPIATDTPIFGETEPNPTPTMPPISKSAVATLYMHATRAPIASACLTNYFACSNQGRVAGFVRNEAQSASVILNRMRKAIEMEDEVSQN